MSRGDAAPAGGGLAEVGVLVAIDDALHRLHAAHNAAAGKQREVVAEEHGNLTEARAAIAELIEAATELRQRQRDYLADPKDQRQESKGRLVGIAADRLDAALAKVASNGDTK